MHLKQIKFTFHDLQQIPLVQVDPHHLIHVYQQEGKTSVIESHHHQYHQNHHHHYYQCHQQPVQQFVTDFIEIILKNYMKTVSAIDHLTMKTAQPKCLYYYNIMIP